MIIAGIVHSADDGKVTTNVTMAKISVPIASPWDGRGWFMAFISVTTTV